ncbi:MAG TPA: hypothetical protein VJ697_14625 [Nitrososphaeraceae archaeon]|nr:hypothetical protein [Nitrososphaeraceae archaeon]
MRLKIILILFAISLYFVSYFLYFDKNYFSIAQQSVISDYDFNNYIEQMKGHLDASIINVQNNNTKLAVAHALHPIEEILDIINSRLIQTNETLTKEFTTKLNNYVQTVRSGNLNEIIIEKKDIEELLNLALNQSISLEKRNNPVYILNVTAELINTASEEYNEAMYNGKIINLLEYQDGQQFIKRTILLLKDSQEFLSDNDKNYIMKIQNIEKDLDLKRDPSEIDSEVKDMICEIKKGLYC